MSSASNSPGELLRAYFHTPSGSPALAEKGLVSGGTFTDKYYTLYENYQRILEAYLLMRLPLKRSDESIRNAGLYFAPVPREAQDFFQQFSFPQLEYLYLRNPLYVENLSREDMELVLRQTEQSLKQPGIELLRLASRTFRDVINEASGEADSTVRHMVCFGPDDDDYWHDSKTMVFGIRYGEFADSPLGEGDEWFENYQKQMSFLGELMEDLEKGCSAILDIPVAFLFYDDTSVLGSMIRSPQSAEEEEEDDFGSEPGQPTELERLFMPEPQLILEPDPAVEELVGFEPVQDIKPRTITREELLAADIEKESAVVQGIAKTLGARAVPASAVGEQVRSQVRSIGELHWKSSQLHGLLPETATAALEQAADACLETARAIPRQYGDGMLPAVYDLLQAGVQHFGNLPDHCAKLRAELDALEKNLILTYSLVQQGTITDIPMEWLTIVAHKVAPKHNQPIPQPQNPPVEKPVKKKRSILPILIAAAVVAVIAIVLASFLMKGQKGRAAMESGDYETAVAILEKSPFHRADYEEACQKLAQQRRDDAEALIAAGQYPEALKHCQTYDLDDLYQKACLAAGNAALEAGRDQLAKKNVAEAGSCFQTALDYFVESADTAAVEEARLFIGGAYLDAREFNTALQYFQANSPMYYYCQAIGYVSELANPSSSSSSPQDRLSRSYDLFKKSEDVKNSGLYQELLKDFTLWNFTDGVELIRQEPQLQDELSLSQWQRFLDQLRKASSACDLSRRLNLELAYATIVQTERALPEVTIARTIDTGSTAIASPIEKAMDIGCDSKEQLLKNLNKDTANGKVLIIKGMRSFNQDSQAWAADFGLMQLLPVHWLPRDLSEVEYLVTVTYNYRDTGERYQNSSGQVVDTKALRESAQVHVYSMKTGSVLFTSKNVQGPGTPESYSYSTKPPAWISGGRPDIGSELFRALEWIQARIK